jgi:hypothetical protein
VRAAHSLAPLLNAPGSTALTLAIIDSWRKLTPALARQSPQVSALSTEAAGDTAEALGNLLTFAAAQFNVGKNLSDVQIAILASEMLRIYWHWRFDEFAFVLREAVAGRYGTTYDRVDAATVHGWCATYEASRNLLEAEQAEHEVRLYKNPKPTPSPLASEPGYTELRAKIEAMSDAELMKGGSYYASLDSPTAEQVLKLAVATEVWGERMAAQQLAAIADSLPGRNVPSAREMAAQEKAEDVQLEYNMATGAYEAAGFKDFAGLQKLVAAGVPAAPAWHQVFPPACPKCTQRPDQCLCK